MARNLRRGNRGTDVAQLQSDLNRYLSPVPLLAVDGDFGRNTDVAVKAFQRREGLTPDGIVGPKTFAALQRNAANTGGGMSYAGAGGGMSMPVGNDALVGAGAGAAAGGMSTPGGGMCYPDGTMDPLPPDTGVDDTPINTGGLTSNMAELAVQIALTQTHVREDPLGSNNGADIQKYCRSAGKSAPALWCMAFVYWCYSEAASRLGQPHPMIGVPDWAKIYVTGCYAWARDNGKTVDTPARGDVFCVRGGSEGRTHKHTGIVTEVDGGNVKTIEGNTNNDGSSNGIGVFARTRTASRLDYFRLP